MEPSFDPRATSRGTGMGVQDDRSYARRAALCRVLSRLFEGPGSPCGAYAESVLLRCGGWPA